MMNELRNAAVEFRTAMAAVGSARNRLAEAVAAEADAPNKHEWPREVRDALWAAAMGDCAGPSCPRNSRCRKTGFEHRRSEKVIAKRREQLSRTWN